MTGSPLRETRAGLIVELPSLDASPPVEIIRTVQQAIDEVALGGGGEVRLGAGEHRVAPLTVPPLVSLIGQSGWGYRHAGATVLRPLSPDQPCLIDARRAHGCRFVGLTLDGQSLGHEMHGLIASHAGVEQNLVVDDCRITHFSGSGISFYRVWVFAIRHSLLMYNRLDGLDATRSCDGWIIDTQIAANDRAGIGSRHVASVTMTANRVEWNRRAGILLGGDYLDQVQINGCMFDRNHGPGIELEGGPRCTSVAICGNMFRNNGFRRTASRPLSSHILARGVCGLSITGNTLRGGTNDRGDEPVSPSAGMWLESLVDSVITGNALYHAAMDELIGGTDNHTNTVITHNPGSLQHPHGVEPR